MTDKKSHQIEDVAECCRIEEKINKAEEEHAEDAKKALEKKAKEKAKKEDDGSEQTTLDL